MTSSKNKTQKNVSSILKIIQINQNCVYHYWKDKDFFREINSLKRDWGRGKTFFFFPSLNSLVFNPLYVLCLF